MNNNSNFTEFKSHDFYFLYLKREGANGRTGDKWHEHSFYEIMLIEEGESEYIIENRHYHAKKGDLLLVKPATYHYKQRVLKNPTAVYCLGFLPEAIKNAGIAEKIFERCEHFSLSELSPIKEIFDAARKKLNISKSNASRFIKYIAEAIILLLCDVDINADEPPKIKNASVEKVLTYIKDNLCEIHKVSDISNALFFSDSYVRTLFKREMNIGIMEYVRNKKVLLAYRKIRHGKKPTEIYAECGFSNYPSFYRAYKAYIGYSPNMQKI